MYETTITGGGAACPPHPDTCHREIFANWENRGNETWGNGEEKKESCKRRKFEIGRGKGMKMSK